MWSIYGNPGYLPLLEMSVGSSNIISPNIDKIILTDKSLNVQIDNCKIEKTSFFGSNASKMSLRYEFASSLLDNYDYVLHIDSDALIFKDISNIYVDKPKGLSLASEYSSEQNSFKKGDGIQNYSSENCWAGPLLEDDEIDSFRSVPSLCMGVWLSGKEDKITLKNIRSEVIKREDSGFAGICVDQHAAVYRLVKDNSWNTHLQKHVTHLGNKINNQNDINDLYDSCHSICHFAGGVQPNITKFNAMNLLIKEIERRKSNE